MISNCQKNVALKYIFFKKKDAFKDELATLKSVKFITHIDPWSISSHSIYNISIRQMRVINDTQGQN